MMTINYLVIFEIVAFRSVSVQFDTTFAKFCIDPLSVKKIKAATTTPPVNRMNSILTCDLFSMTNSEIFIFIVLVNLSDVLFILFARTYFGACLEGYPKLDNGNFRSAIR